MFWAGALIGSIATMLVFGVSCMAAMDVESVVISDFVAFRKLIRRIVKRIKKSMKQKRLKGDTDAV